MKLIGATAVFCAFGWCGIYRAKGYVRRLDCLHSWHMAVSEGERMLCDLNVSTPEYLERLGELPGLGMMARRCIALLREEERLERAWQQAVRLADFPLAAEELRVIHALGTVLGRYDAEDQRRALHYARQQLAAQISAVSEERGRLSRMWSILGVSAGALAVILLY